PARTSASRPQERSSSMVRVLTDVARGSGDRPGLCSTSSEAMPLRARVTAATRPAGPTPPIPTRPCRARAARGIALLLFPRLAEALDGQDPGRVDVGAGVGQGLDQGPEPGPPGLAVAVGVVGVVPVRQGRGPGRGGGEQLAHGVSLVEAVVA